MSAGLSRIELTSLVALTRLLRWPDNTNKKHRYLWVAALIVAGLGAWTLFAAYDSNRMPSKPGQTAVVTAGLEPTSVRNAVSEAARVDSTVEGTGATEQPSPLDKIRISSQSWRRGGLGSKALVTFTLRNENNFAVKDIEILCSFSRSDGSHLTDRTRLIPDTIDMRSRKFFARMHVGFVNVYADRARCTPIAASRA
jgi:hypothetical protein